MSKDYNRFSYYVIDDIRSNDNHHIVKFKTGKEEHNSYFTIPVEKKAEDACFREIVIANMWCPPQRISWLDRRSIWSYNHKYLLWYLSDDDDSCLFPCCWGRSEKK
jgi:hypothetical protein